MMSIVLSLIGRSSSAGSPFRTNWALKSFRCRCCLHALMDAILGAAGMGDIGRLFPDSDDAYLGADSRKLLREVIGRVEEKGWHIHNADVTIICQRPKLISYERAMLENLQEDLGLSGDALNVKATTTEKLGFTGRGEGIAAEAVVLLKK